MQHEEGRHDELIEAHQARLIGWFRARIRDRDTVEDLAQRTWVEVLRRIDSFVEEKGSFWRFTRIWADLVLKRHWEERQGLPVSLDSGGSDGDDPGPRDVPAPPVALEEMLDSTDLLVELLRRTLDCKRLPHEVIAFGFVKLLEWKPQRVVAELAERSLDEAAVLLEQGYLREVPVPAVREAFQPLRSSLGRPLESFRIDQRIKERYAHLAGRPCGSTRLAEYFPAGESGDGAVVRWWDAVGRVVRTDLHRVQTGQLAEWIADTPWARSGDKTAPPSRPAKKGRRKGES